MELFLPIAAVPQKLYLVYSFTSDPGTCDAIADRGKFLSRNRIALSCTKDGFFRWIRTHGSIPPTNWTSRTAPPFIRVTGDLHFACRRAEQMQAGTGRLWQVFEIDHNKLDAQVYSINELYLNYPRETAGIRVPWPQEYAIFRVIRKEAIPGGFDVVRRYDLTGKRLSSWVVEFVLRSTQGFENPRIFMRPILRETGNDNSENINSGLQRAGSEAVREGGADQSEIIAPTPRKISGRLSKHMDQWFKGMENDGIGSIDPRLSMRTPPLKYE